MVSNVRSKSSLAGKRPRDAGHWVLPLVAVAFGLMTIWEGGNVLFGRETARRAAGSYVPFVLWFNFLAGFAYVAAGIGLWKRARWSVGLSFGILVGTAAVFVAFGVHILSGGPYESRTLVAMTLRTAVWLVLALWAYWKVGQVGTE
jgi:hypothetical protein